MNNNIFFLIIIGLLFSKSSTVTPSLPLSEDTQHYTINTADNYSLHTLSDTHIFKNVKVSEIAEVINNNLSEYGSISINETLNMLVVKEVSTKIKNIIELCKKLDQDGMGDFLEIRTRRIPLKYNKSSDIQKYLNSYLSLDGSIQSDDNFNVIIAHDHESKLDLIEQEIKKFDLIPQQIKVDINILEISNVENSNFGINWSSLLDGNFQIKWSKQQDLDQDSRDDYTNDVATNKYDSKDSFIREDSETSIYINTPLEDFVQILEGNDQVNLKASPSIVTLNNRNGEVSTSDIVVQVVPSIGESDIITLNIHCTLEASNNDFDEIESTILVKEGETFILGGFKKTEQIKESKGLPFLGRLLPKFFSKEITYNETIEIAIMLTPTKIDINNFGQIIKSNVEDLNDK